MRWRTRSITWHGQSFRFQLLALPENPETDTGQWAVHRSGEFIGTMPCSSEVNTRDFDVRSMRWLTELLGNAVGRHAKP